MVAVNIHMRKYIKKIHLSLKNCVHLIDSFPEKVEIPNFYFRFVLDKKSKFEYAENEEHQMK